MAASELDQAYWAYLDQLHEWSIQNYRRVWRGFDPARASESLRRMAPVLAVLHRTQVQAAMFASDDYATLAAAKSGTVIEPDWRLSPKWSARPGQVASGATLEDVLASVRSGFLWMMKAGEGPEKAGQLATGRSLAPFASEPAQVARNYTWDMVIDPTMMEDDGVFRQWRRVPKPGACDFCLMLATRGAAYRTKETALFTEDGRRYHDFCRCTAQLVTSQFNRADVAVSEADAQRRIKYRASNGSTYTYDVSDFLTPPPRPVWVAG